MPQTTVTISQKNMSGRGSGIQRKVYDEIRVFKSRGYRVYVIAEKIDKKSISSEGAHPIKVFRWPLKGYVRRFKHSLYVSKKIKRIKPDLVIGHGDIHNQDILYIHNCVHLAHELQHQEPLPASEEVGRLHSNILKQGQYKLLICNSELMKRDLVSRFELDSDKAIVIYPEFDSTRFNLRSASALRQQKRKDLDIDDQEVVVGLITSGSFDKRNVKLLIDSIAKLPPSQLQKVKVIVAGKDKADKYLELAKSLGIKEKIIFLPAINDVESYYHAIDIFALPAKIEEFGRSALEAMACAKPVVLSSNVGCAEILEGESKSFILPSLDSSSLSEKLEALIESPELRSKLAQLNHQTAQQYTNQHQEVKLIETLEARKII